MMNTKRNILSLISKNGGAVGDILLRPVDALPTGYLEMDGSSLSTALYPALFALIGYQFGGSGDTFCVPDTRGEFIRGWDNGRGIDSGRNIGSFQADSFKSHDHSITLGNHYNGSIYPAGGLSTINGSEKTTSTGEAETRPRNIAMMYCIKY